MALAQVIQLEHRIQSCRFPLLRGSGGNPALAVGASLAGAPSITLETLQPCNASLVPLRILHSLRAW